MLELEDALQRILDSLPDPQSERVPLPDAIGRISAGKVISPIDLPRFDNSSMDGYAVRSADFQSVPNGQSRRLVLKARVAAGQPAQVPIESGESIRVFTGSILPNGADAVVMQEETRTDPDHPGQIEFLEAPKPWENVRFRGEDVRAGAVLLEAGQKMSAGRATLLAAAGVSEIEVGRRPIVGLVATGSELRESGQPLDAAQIYESNRIAIAALVNQAGGVARVFPIVPDDPSSTRAALERAFHECDLVITCGGVSVGEMDFVKSAFESLGGRLEFWKVAIKPGRPFVFGKFGARFLFGLPGNPVSALVTFLLLVRTAILKWQGADEIRLPAVLGRLMEPVSNPGNRRHFMRVRIDAKGDVRSAGTQASHLLHSLAAANGLLDLAPGAALEAGRTVPVLRWEPD